MDVTIKTLPPLHVAYVRHVGPYPECHKAWMILCGWALLRGLNLFRTTFLGLTHDDPQKVPPDKLRYDACFVVPEGIAPEGAVRIKDIPGGNWAVYVHKGPFEEFPDVYDMLLNRWLPSSGYRFKGGATMNIHLTAPDITPPEERLTEIRIPLA